MVFDTNISKNDAVGLIWRDSKKTVLNKPKLHCKIVKKCLKITMQHENYKNQHFKMSFLLKYRSFCTFLSLDIADVSDQIIGILFFFYFRQRQLK